MVNGGFAYGYLFLSQHPDIKSVFEKFLKIAQPTRIVEIGTFHGGLTLMLRDILDFINLPNSQIITYDIEDQKFLKPLVTNRNIIVKTKNLFAHSYHEFKDNNHKTEIESFIQQDGRTIVLCDGGCKKCEFNLIAPLLKPQDIIMAHDYAPNEEYFNAVMKNKIWDWLEIQDEDIQHTYEQNNLIPYHQDLMIKVAWLSRIKE